MDARTVRRWLWGQVCDPYVGLALIALALIAYGVRARGREAEEVGEATAHGLTRDHRRQCAECAAAFARDTRGR